MLRFFLRMLPQKYTWFTSRVTAVCTVQVPYIQFIQPQHGSNCWEFAIEDEMFLDLPAKLHSAHNHLSDPLVISFSCENEIASVVLLETLSDRSVYCMQIQGKQRKNWLSFRSWRHRSGRSSGSECQKSQGEISDKSKCTCLSSFCFSSVVYLECKETMAYLQLQRIRI